MLPSACISRLCVFHFYTISTHTLYITALCDRRLRKLPSSAAHTHTPTFACFYDNTWLCLYLSVHWVFVCGCVQNSDVWLWASCVDSLNPNLAWSVGQLVLHRLTPPMCVSSSHILSPACHYWTWRGWDLLETLNFWQITIFRAEISFSC